jgi:hypothetical protein
MTRPKRNRVSVRLNLELSETLYNRLIELQTLSDADSMTEVIRKALSVYDLLLEARKAKDKIIIRSSNEKEKELVIV